MHVYSLMWYFDLHHKWATNIIVLYLICVSVMRVLVKGNLHTFLRNLEQLIWWMWSTKVGGVVKLGHP